MTDRRTIFIGKKPLHAYVRAVVMAMESGDRNLELVARGLQSEEQLMLQRFAAEEMELLPKACLKR